MSWLELTILSICLCFDTFAVSLCGGILLCRRSLSIGARMRIILSFALFQSGFLALGWGVGEFLANYFGAIDHWVTFAILLWIGGKMLYESLFHPEEDQSASDLLNPRRLVVLSIATSIDAVAVGVSLALLAIAPQKALFTIAATALATAAASYIGLAFGKALGRRIGKAANIAGGIILILIGVKILFEHLMQ